uniref:hypothetical protein n=1 Tax=Actinoplanes sp. CA-084688 TaxID=3239901 RepID=UPI003F493AE7
MTGHQREQQASLKNRFAVLGLVADTTAPSTPAKAAPPRKRASSPPSKRAAAKHAEPATAPQPEATPMPVAQVAIDEARPKRLMVPLSVEEDKVLKELRVADGITAAGRIRAMLQIYRTDDRVRRKVDQAARDMRGH